MLEEKSIDRTAVASRGGFITSADVAERAGVSRSAVSRTFTPGASVSPDVKRRVLAAADELGYRVNRLARGLISARSNLVGLVCANLGSPIAASLLSSTMSAFSARGLNALVFEFDSDRMDMRVEMQRILEFRVEAIVVMSGLPPTSIVEECQANGVRLVIVNRPADPGPGCFSIMSDDAAGARIAADRLVRSGARRLAVVASESDTPSQLTRIKAFVDQAATYGHDVTIARVGPTSYECGRLGAQVLYPRKIKVRPDGVFCAKDLIAFGFMDAIRADLGLKVPQDVSVIGFDDVPQSAWGAYDLTTLKQNTTEVARSIVKVVRSDGHEPERVTTVPVSLVERGTVRT